MPGDHDHPGIPGSQISHLADSDGSGGDDRGTCCEIPYIETDKQAAEVKKLPIRKLDRKLFLNAAGRGRTGTGITTHGILSPGRLPIPPLRRIHNEIVNGAYRARTYDPLLVRQMLSQLS